MTIGCHGDLRIFTPPGGVYRTLRRCSFVVGKSFASSPSCYTLLLVVLCPSCGASTQEMTPPPLPPLPPLPGMDSRAPRGPRCRRSGLDRGAGPAGPSIDRGRGGRCGPRSAGRSAPLDRPGRPGQDRDRGRAVDQPGPRGALLRPRAAARAPVASGGRAGPRRHAPFSPLAAREQGPCQNSARRARKSGPWSARFDAPLPVRPPRTSEARAGSERSYDMFCSILSERPSGGPASASICCKRGPVSLKS